MPSDLKIFNSLCNIICLFNYSQRGFSVKESACNAGDPGSIPGLGRSPGEGIPGEASGKEPACQCRRWKRCQFDP